ncbi:hypothetical protein TNCV_2963331 [Trichonephila clavipes]|nr:hypothetical protein TNCV_2963331 [Trichonephila clavipes]
MSPNRLITSRMTAAGSLLPPVYSEAWAKENAKDGKRRKEEVEWTRKKAKNREGTLEYPRFMKPVFTKDSKPLGKRKRSLGHLEIVTPVI